MKNEMKNKFLALAIIAIGFSTSASAQASADASVSTTANIVLPLTITAGDDMDFGYIVSSVAGGTVRVDTLGALTGTGVTVHSSAVGAAATFVITGEEGFTFDITMPASFNLTGPALSTPMSVGTFVSGLGAVGTLTGGTQTLKVGATLTVNANQAAGEYTNASDFAVTVVYN